MNTAPITTRDPLAIPPYRFAELLHRLDSMRPIDCKRELERLWKLGWHQDVIRELWNEQRERRGLRVVA